VSVTVARVPLELFPIPYLHIAPAAVQHTRCLQPPSNQRHSRATNAKELPKSGLGQGNLVPVTAVLHFKKITANSRFHRVRGIAQGRLLRMRQRVALSKRAADDRNALFQRITKDRNRHAQRRSARNMNLRVTACRRAANRGKPANDSFASDQCYARAGDLA